MNIDESKNIYFLNENTNNNLYFLGFFKYYMFHYLSCFRKNKRNFNLYKIENFLKDHINDKFDLLKYYKRYNHYKYLKKVVLSEEQKNALKKICNLKCDYKTNYKPFKKDHYEEEDRDVNRIALELKNDIIDGRIKNLIESYFVKKIN